MSVPFYNTIWRCGEYILAGRENSSYADIWCCHFIFIDRYLLIIWRYVGVLSYRGCESGDESVRAIAINLSGPKGAVCSKDGEKSGEALKKKRGASKAPRSASRGLLDPDQLVGGKAQRLGLGYQRIYLLLGRIG